MNGMNKTILAIISVVVVLGAAAAISQEVAGDDQLSFDVKYDKEFNELSVTFNQEVTDESIDGTLVMDDGTEFTNIPFAPADKTTFYYEDVNGTVFGAEGLSDGSYTLTLTTSQGQVSQTFQISTDLTIISVPGVDVTVTVNGTEDTGDNGVYQLAEGDEVTITAVVSDTEQYKGTPVIKVGDAEQSNPYTFTLEKDTTVTIDGVESVIPTYTVTYMLDGAPSGDVETYTEGAEVTVRDQVEGYSAWATDSIVEIVDGKFAMPAYDIVFSAATVTDHTVTIDEMDGIRYVVTDADGNAVVFTGGKAVVEDGAVLSFNVRIGSQYEGTPVVMVNDTEHAVDGSSARFDVTVTEDITVTVTGIYDPDDMRNMTVSGESNTGNTTFDANQIVTVVDTWTLVAGADITILGQLIVPEGCTIVISNDATLTIGGTVVSATTLADIAGSIIIEDADSDVAGSEQGVFSVVNGEVTISGSATVAGVMTVSGGKVTATDDASILVESTGSLVAAEDVVIGETASLTVEGKVTGTIYNAGTVTIDSDEEVTEAVNVIMTAAGATVDVQKITSDIDGAAIVITDENIVLAGDVKAKNANKVELSVTSEGTVVNGHVHGIVSGVTVVESIDSESSRDSEKDGYYNGRVYTNTMDVSGTVAVSAEFVPSEANPNESTPEDMDADASLTVSGSSIAVSGALTAGSGVTLVNNGVMTVSGTVDATAVTSGNTPAADASIVNNGTVEVVGEGHVSVVTDKVNTKLDSVEGSKVEATEYSVKSGNLTIYHYVTIDTALATVNAEGNTITQLNVLGTKQEVTVSATVPADVTLNISAEGQKLTIADDVQLTIASGARVIGNGEIAVDGTLYAEVFNRISGTIDIIADTFSYATDDKGAQNKASWARWTNLANALAEADPGDVVEIYKEKTDGDGYIHIASNLIIPEDVTLYVENGKAPLLLEDGVTLTINGTLDTEEDVYAETRFSATAMNVSGEAGKQTSAVVVNGYLFVNYAVGKLTYVADGEAAAEGYAKLTSGAPVSGAYYVYDVATYAVSPLANAVDVLDDITSEKIEINGTVNAGDVTFTATDICDEIVVNEGSDLTVGTLVLSGATLTVDGEVSGDVAIGDASVTLRDVSGIVVSGTSLTLAGTATGTSVTVSAGEVTGKLTSNVDTFTVAEGATLVSDGASIKKLVVDGAVTVASNKTLTVTSEAVINGAVDVASNGRFIAAEIAGADTVKVTVNGTLTNAAITSTTAAGTVDIDTLYVSAEATVSGPVVVDVAYVYNGATLDDAAVESLPENSTGYYVEETLWLTAYAEVLDVDIYTVDGSDAVEDAVFNFWAYEDNGVMKKIEATEGVSGKYVGDYDAVYADVEYDIYTIILRADAGIDDVTIDNNLMAYGLVSVGSDYFYAYTATVAAGTHTINYTLANGYDGTATLKVNGEAQSSLSFSTSGAPAEYSLQLSGIEKSGYVDPVDPTPVQPSDDGDDGMTITDYLLIVLVVLIVIIAILVAVRLMRS